VLAMRLTHLSKREAEGFTPFIVLDHFRSLTDFMSSGPCVVLALEAPEPSSSGAR
jgi:nucleoside diphosphate kinase